MRSHPILALFAFVFQAPEIGRFVSLPSMLLAAACKPHKSVSRKENLSGKQILLAVRIFLLTPHAHEFSPIFPSSVMMSGGPLPYFAVEFSFFASLSGIRQWYTLCPSPDEQLLFRRNLLNHSCFALRKLS